MLTKREKIGEVAITSQSSCRKNCAALKKMRQSQVGKPDDER